MLMNIKNWEKGGGMASSERAGEIRRLKCKGEVVVVVVECLSFLRQANNVAQAQTHTQNHTEEEETSLRVRFLSAAAAAGQRVNVCSVNE